MLAVPTLSEHHSDISGGLSPREKWRISKEHQFVSNTIEIISELIEMDNDRESNESIHYDPRETRTRQNTHLPLVNANKKTNLSVVQDFGEE